MTEEKFSDRSKVHARECAQCDGEGCRGSSAREARCSRLSRDNTRRNRIERRPDQHPAGASCATGRRCIKVTRKSLSAQSIASGSEFAAEDCMAFAYILRAVDPHQGVPRVPRGSVETMSSETRRLFRRRVRRRRALRHRLPADLDPEGSKARLQRRRPEAQKVRGTTGTLDSSVRSLDRR
jgi:hypothetical protein